MDATANTAFVPGAVNNTVTQTLSQGNDFFNYSCGFNINADNGGNPVQFTSVTGPSSGSDMYTNQTVAEHFDTLELKFDNSSRFSPRKASYFRTCQPIQAGHRVPKKHIYLYSFALNAEDYQPSGTVNCSKIDQIDFKFNSCGAGGSVNDRNLVVYAVNYNILRIMSGMGGLAYTN